MFPRVPTKDRIKILEAFIPMAADAAKWKSLEDISNIAGKEATGKSISIYSIRAWAKESEEIGILYAIALHARAECYCKMAQEALLGIQDFWTDEKGVTKERLNAVNKAKLMIEHYIYLMGKLAPDVYGDYYTEIKEMQDKIKKIQVEIDIFSKERKGE